MSEIRISYHLESSEDEELLSAYLPFCPPYANGQTIFLEKEVHPNAKDREKGFKLTRFVITDVHHGIKEIVRLDGQRLSYSNCLSMEVWVKKSKG